MTVRLRAVTESDLPAIRDIYTPFVEETAITFAYDPPTLEDWNSKLDAKTHHPWLVCERDSEIAGYAYAGPVRKRAAYQWAIETSVYVAPDHQRHGIARGLYLALCELLARQGYVTAFAVITTPNPASIAFHESMGFDRVGRFEAVGYKHDAWHDVEWWSRELRERPESPDEPLSVAEAQQQQWWDDALEAGRSAIEQSE